MILVLNKVDLIAKTRLLPLIEHYRQAHPFVEIVPVSAVDGTNVDVLERLFLQLPAGGRAALSARLPDRSDRALLRRRDRARAGAAADARRAAVLDRGASSIGSRRPATTASLKLYCTILVERESQKPIVVGKGGAMIKAIGTAARAELERYFEQARLSRPARQGEVRVARRRAHARRDRPRTAARRGQSSIGPSAAAPAGSTSTARPGAAARPHPLR